MLFRSVVVAIPDSDGIAVDAAGGLWVARFMTSRMERYDAQGRLERAVETPYKAVASLTFGGDDLRDVYVAGGDLETADAGGIARIRVETPGRRPHVARLALRA